MLTNIIRPEPYISTSYELCFDDGANNGFGFPCDEQGNLLDGLQQAAIDNYHWCLENPEKFVRFNKVITHKQWINDTPYGTCTCGETVYLQNEYMGACECHNCGQWYNLFGQELNSPETWSKGEDW